MYDSRVLCEVMKHRKPARSSQDGGGVQV